MGMDWGSGNSPASPISENELAAAKADKIEEAAKRLGGDAGPSAPKPSLFGRLRSAASKAIGGVSSVATKGASTVADTAGKAADVASSAAKTGASGVAKAADGVATVANKGVDQAKSAGTKAVDAADNLRQAIKEKAREAMQTPGDQLHQTVNRSRENNRSQGR